MAELTEAAIVQFVETLTDEQLEFMRRWQGDTPCDDGSNHSKVYVGVYQEIVRRLWRPTRQAS